MTCCLAKNQTNNFALNCMRVHRLAKCDLTTNRPIYMSIMMLVYTGCLEKSTVTTSCDTSWYYYNIIIDRGKQQNIRSKIMAHNCTKMLLVV